MQWDGEVGLCLAMSGMGWVLSTVPPPPTQYGTAGLGAGPPASKGEEGFPNCFQWGRFT